MEKRINKFLSVVISLLMVVQSILPGLFYLANPSVVSAQEASPSSEIAEPTSLSETTPSPQPSVTPSIEPSPSPSAEPEPTPQPQPEVNPAPSEELTPNVSPNPPPAESTSTESSSLLPSESPTPEPSPSPEITTVEPAIQGHLSAEILHTDNTGSLQLDLNPTNSVTSASLTTDKDDYSPTDTAVITGTDFPKEAQLSLIITADNYRFEDSVKTDENGSFTYFYQLDGTYRPLYIVEAYDLSGTLLATTTFTDSPGKPSADLDQCRNGSAGTPNDCVVLGGGQGWVNGNANSTQAHYLEGYSVPYRTVMTELPTDGTLITIDLGYDIKHGGANAIDYLTHYQRLEPHTPFGHSAESVDPTSGVSGLSATTTTFAIPAPSSAGSPVAGQPTDSFNSLPAGERVMTVFGGTITDVAYISEGSLTNDNSETVIRVTFTADSSTAVLSWGGHIASEDDWGEGKSAGGINGSPYHMRLKVWSLGNLGNQDRSLAADAVVTPGTITVRKDVVPNDSSLWDFSLTGPNSFSASASDIGDGGSSTFSSLVPGSYTLSETTDPNYTTSVSCNTGESGGGSVSITLEEGENVTCTFTNTIAQGTLRVIKDVVPDDQSTWDITISSSEASESATLSDGGSFPNSTGLLSLPTGSYTITEPTVVGYNSTFSCVEGEGEGENELVSGSGTTINIDLAKDQDITCTFTNTFVPPVLTITKTNNRLGIDVSPGSDVLYTLTVTLEGSPLTDVELHDLLPNGFTYRPGSWTATSNINASLSVPEPNYTSPGVWFLGNMVPGEIITLTLIADIASNIDLGLYPDLAWAQGTGASSTEVFAIDTADGDTFVGTEVNVVQAPGGSVFDVLREEFREGEVLGISTELPSTGADSRWVFLAFVLLLLGMLSVGAGLSLRRKYE